MYPAIGMVDVQFPSGSHRFPVEDLQIMEDSFWVRTPSYETVPGGAGQVSVSGGPQSESPKRASNPLALSQKVARRFLKEALYWTNVDRRYRATKSEQDTKRYFCPKCKDTVLKRCVYKRNGGSSEKLLGCSSCLFLIKPSDIDRCHLNVVPDSLSENFDE